MKITKDTTIGELADTNDEVVGLLMSKGMHCIGCPMAMMETVEQGCSAHGMDSKEIDELVKKLNSLL